MLSACLADPVSVDAKDGLSPFFTASFDHAPTQGEIDQALMSFIASPGGNEHQGVVAPGSATAPSPGYKLVTLTVKTGSFSGDGMDAAAQAYFLGTWFANTAGTPSYTERFILDDPSRDDLNRSSTNVFYYLLRLNSYVPGATADQFVRGRIGNTSTDRWRCEYIWVDDRNYLGTSRIQALYFNTSVEAPGPQESGDLNATNLTWLSYGG